MASHMVKELQEFYIRVDSQSGELEFKVRAHQSYRGYKSSHVSNDDVAAAVISTWIHFVCC